MSAITAAIPIPRAAADRPSINPWIIAATVTLATFMELLDTAIANVALPHIAGGLAVSYDESTWVLTSYLVSNAVVLPLSAWLSRVFGRKRYYMLCVLLFTVSSLLCGLAPSLGLLIFFRVLQGVGEAASLPWSRRFWWTHFRRTSARQLSRFIAWQSSRRRRSARRWADGLPTNLAGAGSFLSTFRSGSCL